MFFGLSLVVVIPAHAGGNQEVDQNRREYQHHKPTIKTDKIKS